MDEFGNLPKPELQHNSPSYRRTPLSISDNGKRSNIEIRAPELPHSVHTMSDLDCSGLAQDRMTA